MSSRDTGFYLGRSVGEPREAVVYDPSDLVTHGIVVGMTGSGKTGLAIVALEEAARAGIPTLVIDPKGDMANLLLRFPSLEGREFEPWVDPAKARDRGISVQELATAEAATWRNGLADWGLGGDDIADLVSTGVATVYTPGSSAGTPLNVIGDLSGPASADEETVRAETAMLVSGLLELMGVDSDPLSSREHILLSNLIDHGRRDSKSMDLGVLIQQVMKPPFRKLGVFDVETFYPADERTKLAMRLNALVASPTFSAWVEGEPLDIDRLLYAADGKPKCSIIYLAHLTDAERQFVVSLLLARVITWMRAQPGTSDLRALLYMDEVFGFAPPSAEPPSKKAILTILKQARAYGVGFLLSTQNPMDLDYKVMSNAGTWMVGRLQTERDKARILEGMQSISGNIGPDELGALINNLESREFVLHNTHDSGGPRVFGTRWALSYLRGPLTKDELSRISQPTQVPDKTRSAATARAAAQAPDSLADGDSRIAPRVPDGIPMYFLDANAPWASEFGAVAGSGRFEPAIVARVVMKFDDTKSEIDHSEEWEAAFFPVSPNMRPEDAIQVDYDLRDLEQGVPGEPIYVAGDAPLESADFYEDLRRSLKDWLFRGRKLEVSRNKALKMFSRVSESSEDFATRCDVAAQDNADQEAAKIRNRFESKMDRVREAIARAEDRVEQLAVDTKSRRSHEMVAGLGDLLGGFLTGKQNARSIASRAGRTAKGVSSRRSVTTRTEQRRKGAVNALDDKLALLEDVEQELTDELVEIDEKWREIAMDVDVVSIPLEKNDIDVTEVALVWVPVG